MGQGGGDCIVNCNVSTLSHWKEGWRGRQQGPGLNTTTTTRIIFIVYRDSNRHNTNKQSGIKEVKNGWTQMQMLPINTPWGFRKNAVQHKANKKNLHQQPSFFLTFSLHLFRIIRRFKVKHWHSHHDSEVDSFISRLSPLPHFFLPLAFKFPEKGVYPHTVNISWKLRRRRRKKNQWTERRVRERERGRGEER